MLKWIHLIIFSIRFAETQIGFKFGRNRSFSVGRREEEWGFVPRRCDPPRIFYRQVALEFHTQRCFVLPVCRHFRCYDGFCGHDRALTQTLRSHHGMVAGQSFLRNIPFFLSRFQRWWNRWFERIDHEIGLSEKWSERWCCETEFNLWSQ